MPVKAINFTLFVPTLVANNVYGAVLQSTLSVSEFTSRRDAVLYNQQTSYWSYSSYTHSYLLSRDDQPVCSAYQSPLTVKHFLIVCVNFAAIRSRHFSASSMKDVFESVNAQSVIDFIKEINFYHEL